MPALREVQRVSAADDAAPADDTAAPADDTAAPAAPAAPAHQYMHGWYAGLFRLGRLRHELRLRGRVLPTGGALTHGCRR
jgi:hypothetical protein